MMGLVPLPNPIFEPREVISLTIVQVLGDYEGEGKADAG